MTRFAPGSTVVLRNVSDIGRDGRPRQHTVASINAGGVVVLACGGRHQEAALDASYSLTPCLRCEQRASRDGAR